MLKKLGCEISGPGSYWDEPGESPGTDRMGFRWAAGLRYRLSRVLDGLQGFCTD
jgi:hypothetical protein